jgi:hypothetical protein
MSVVVDGCPGDEVDSIFLEALADDRPASVGTIAKTKFRPLPMHQLPARHIPRRRTPPRKKRIDSCPFALL